MQPTESPFSDVQFSDAFFSSLDKAAAILDQKTKPPGSLGRIESIAMQVSAIQHSLTPDVERARAILFAADHGVVAEGVSAYPQSVTHQMLLNFTTGGAAANALCKANTTELEVVDVGVIGDVIQGVVTAKVANGTANMAQQAAMSEEQLSWQYHVCCSHCLCSVQCICGRKCWPWYRARSTRGCKQSNRCQPGT